MNQVYDGCDYVILVHYNQELENLLDKTFTRIINENLMMWKKPKDTSIVQILNNFKSANVKNYLGIFDLIFLSKDRKKDKNVYELIYQFIGKKYENLIDKERNLDNLTLIKDILDHLCPHFELNTILDFGCGSGLSKLIFTNCVNIYGYDKNEELLILAKNRQMKIIRDLKEKKYNCYFDIVIGSYVFHLIREEEDLYLLNTILKGNGIIIGNFHKNQNLELISNYFIDSNFEIIENHQTLYKNKFNHGVIKVFKKNY